MRLSPKDRKQTEAKFAELRSLIAAGPEKYQKNKFRTTIDATKQMILKKAKALDELESSDKAAAAETVPEQAEQAEAQQSNPGMLTFLGAFGIIVREGLEAILVIAAIIASVEPQVTTMFLSASIVSPVQRLCFLASASRKFCAPHVMAY